MDYLFETFNIKQQVGNLRKWKRMQLLRITRIRPLLSYSIEIFIEIT